MKEKLVWIIFGALTLGILTLFLNYPPTTSGGDIVDYFGITETLSKDNTLHLTQETKWNLEKVFNPVYFSDPLYYIPGRDGNRYPIHFFFYSLLALPVRFVLHVLSINELHTLRLTNLLIFSITSFLVLRYFIKSTFAKFVFLLLFYLCPLVWFLIWPGPDVYYVCLLLLAVFSFFQKRYFLATILSAFASWHSQPLLVITLFLLGYTVVKNTRAQLTYPHMFVQLHAKTMVLIAGIFGILVIPYLYNIYAFRVLNPWITLNDGWTHLYGFGLQNISVKKFFEQFFDPNIGLFWYAPALVIGGLVVIVKRLVKNKDKGLLVLFIGFLLTTFFYQTNPAWNYGTSGYGPSRHILFFLPLLIASLVAVVEKTKRFILLLIFFVLSQVFVMSFNGFLTPDFMKTHDHTPYAHFLLRTFPSLYNPTPEIFADRTNHAYLRQPASAIYRVNGVCKKAYVLKSDGAWLTSLCGSMPKETAALFKNPLKTKASYKRTITTDEATLWPDLGSCAKEYSVNGKFICMHTVDAVVAHTGIIDRERITTIPDYGDGVWKIKKGAIITFTLPPGYTSDYTAMEGVYVNY